MASDISKIIKGNVISNLLIAATILTSGVIINIIQLLLHVTVKPVNKNLFHKLMYYVSWTWLAQIVFIYDVWSNSELIIYCKPEDFALLGKEHTFTLMNHTYEIDWLVGWVIIDRFECLGNARGFIKNVIKYIPIAGWFFGFAEHIFLQRNYEKDKAVIEARLEYIMNYREPIWPVMTAEGTRFTPEKYQSSVKFAKEKGLTPLKHHLIPRAKGFITCVPIMKKYNCPSVLNIQLIFDKDAKVKPTLANLLRGEKVVAHVYIERIPIDQVEGTSEYLQKVYHEKDELHESFLNYGNFFEGRNQKPIDGIKMKPRLCILINSIMWTTLSFSMMLYYATSLILKGQFLFMLSISGGVIVLFYVLMRYIINASKVKKGSQYGKS